MHGITMIFPDVFEDIQIVKICARVAAWRHENIWKYHRDSMHIQILLPEEFSGSSGKFFTTPGKPFWQKNLNMHGITMIFPGALEDVQIVKICARVAAWWHRNTWKYHRDSIHIQIFFARKIFREL